MIIIVIIYILILFIWSNSHPTKYAIGYIIFISNFGGLISPEMYLINGTDYTSLLLNLSCITPILFKFRNTPKIGKFLIISWLIFYIYGLIRPVLLGYQDIILSIKSSKSFMAYAFASYLIVNYKYANFYKILKFILYLSIYFCILYICANFIHIGNLLPAYEKDDYIQCSYDSFIYFSLYYVWSKYFNRPLDKKLFISLILVFGIFLGGYFSLLACCIIFLCTLAAHALLNKYSYRSKFIIGIICIIICIFIYNLVASSGYLDEIIQNQLSAFESRDRHNLLRNYLISKQLIFGYGFISPDSNFMLQNIEADNQYAQSLSFIDSGYTDLLGKFGVFGTIIFLFVPLITLWKLKISLNNIFFIFIISFYAINVTWAVLCYPMGIIDMGLVFSLLLYTYSSTQDSEY